MAGDDDDGREHDAGPGPPGEQPGRGRRSPAARSVRAQRDVPRGAAGPGSASTAAEHATTTAATIATTGSRAAPATAATSSTISASASLHDLTGGAFPGDSAQAAADIAGVAAVLHAPVHVAEHAAGQRRC